MRLLDAKVDSYERMAARTDRPPSEVITELRENLSGHVLDLGRVNAAWALLHELRDWLCMNALYDDLMTTVVVDVANDIPYLDPTRAVRARDDLTQITTDLQKVGPRRRARPLAPPAAVRGDGSGARGGCGCRRT